MDDTSADDPKGLIRESYRIEGITLEECRSIFLDWAISVPVEADDKAAIRSVLAFYAADKPDHPMTQVLTEGLEVLNRPKGRRGGRAARVSN